MKITVKIPQYDRTVMFQLSHSWDYMPKTQCSPTEIFTPQCFQCFQALQKLMNGIRLYVYKLMDNMAHIYKVKFTRSYLG